VRFGIHIVPEDGWRAARDKWQRAERMGFHHAWTYDHLNWRWFRARNWYTCVPTLTAAALATSRIGIGVLVASPNLRHPVALAKDVATIDDMSGGRLILGMGAGAGGFDSTMMVREPWTPRERADRFAEYVTVTDQLLTQPVTTFEGRYYVANEVHSYPLRRVPLAVAATGPKGMRLAARYGQYWVTTGVPNRVDQAADRYETALPVIRRQVEAVDKACVEAGRDPATLSRLLVAGPSTGGVLASKSAFFDAAARFAEVGITDLVVQWPRPDEPFQGDEAVLDQIAEDLADHTD
jgi:alkanesulfonate monooxygenase SsuD/methylene tetrahydromethanopterin reductase-like flavin-dependent oxidoreductase (luciferase family)